MIQYVGILGYRHSSYALVDMRIHDINVVCDLSRRNPGAPDIPPPNEDSGEGSDYDGTGQLLTDSSYEIEVIDFCELVLGQLTPSWILENCWPWMHLIAEEPSSSDSDVDIHVSADLLQTTRVHTLAVTTGPEQERTPEQVEQDGADFWDHLCMFVVGYAAHAALAFLIGQTIRVIDTLSAKIITPTDLAIVTVMIIAWLVLVNSYFQWLLFMVNENGMHPWSAASSVLFLMVGLFLGFAARLSKTWGLFSHFWKWCDKGDGVSGLWPKDIFQTAFAIVSLVFKIYVLVGCFYYFNTFYTLGCQVES